MHNKAVFALAGVFLAVALVIPPLILIFQTNQQIVNILIPQNQPGHETSGNLTITQLTQYNATINLIALTIEAVFAILFVVTIYYGINHVHPSHKPEKD